MALPSVSRRSSPHWRGCYRVPLSPFCQTCSCKLSGHTTCGSFRTLCQMCLSGSPSWFPAVMLGRGGSRCTSLACCQVENVSGQVWAPLLWSAGWGSLCTSILTGAGPGRWCESTRYLGSKQTVRMPPTHTNDCDQVSRCVSGYRCEVKTVLLHPSGEHPPLDSIRAKSRLEQLAADAWLQGKWHGHRHVDLVCLSFPVFLQCGHAVTTTASACNPAWNFLQAGELPSYAPRKQTTYMFHWRCVLLPPLTYLRAAATSILQATRRT